MPFRTRGRRLSNLSPISGLRWALNFDGVGIRGQLANRAINPDGDIDVEFYAPSVLNGSLQTIISQCISATFTVIEFRVLVNASNVLGFLVGGNNADVLTPAEGFEAGKKYRLRLVGSTLTIWKGDLTGAPLKTLTFNRGAAREPTAQFVIGASTNNTIGVFFRYFTGIQRDVKINGTLWPMADRNQSIQLPEPSGLGTEMLVNPMVSSNGIGWGKDSITVQSLTINSFKLINSINSYAGAIFQTIPTIVGDKYVIRFKVGFQTASTNFRVSINSTTAAQYTGDLLAANYTVSDQYLFVVFTATTTSATVRLLCNSSNAGAYVEVSELTVKPLGTCNPMTISNATSANWVEVPA